MGAYEHALAYAQTREQFGKPIGKFQLVQDLLVKMLGNITASLCMVVRLSQMQDQGKLKDEHASLAKAFCTVKMRETVGLARELLGANGILLDYQVGTLCCRCRSYLLVRGHARDEHPHRWQGDHWLWRVRINARTIKFNF